MPGRERDMERDIERETESERESEGASSRRAEGVSDRNGKVHSFALGPSISTEVKSAPSR